MNDIEATIRKIIIDRYGSLKKFCEIIDMPWTTLDSILKRGIANSNITNVMKITKELNVDTESLVSGVIIAARQTPEPPQVLAAHFEGDEYTEEELEEIRQFAEFVKLKNRKK